METYPQLVSTDLPHLWCSRADIGEHVVNIPPTFDPNGKQLYPIVKKVVGGWLAQLIGASRVNTLEGVLTTFPSDPLTNDEKLIVAVKPFLANAVWSLYLLQGGISYSDTGPVQRVADESVGPISDKRRAELSRYYRDEAERYAVVLSGMVSTDTCGVIRRTQTTRISSASGYRKSRF